MTTTKAQASFRADGIARFTAGEPLPAKGAAPKHILALSGADAQISRDPAEFWPQRLFAFELRSPLLPNIVSVHATS